MSNIQTKQSNLPAASTSSNEPFITAEDLVVPRVLLMQGASDLVKKRKAQYGDMIDSVEHKILGNPEKPIEVVPFHLVKSWIIYAIEGKDKKYLRTEPIHSANENLPYQAKENGIDIERDKVYNFYCVLSSDLLGLPYIVSFRRSSMKAAKTITTQMYFRNVKAGLQKWATAIELGATEESYDGHTYMTFTAKPKRVATKEEQEVCAQWASTIGTMKVDAIEDEKPVEQEVVKVKSMKDLPNKAPQAKQAPVLDIDLDEKIPF